MKRKSEPIPFDEQLSAELDKAVVACESDDPARQELGKIWKRRLEQKIWGRDD